MSKKLINEILILRKKTGLGIMTCKKALIEANGDINQAIEILIQKGKNISSFKVNHQNDQGVVIATTNSKNNIGVIIKLTCQTDFVAKNNLFIDLAKEILEISLSCNDIDSILNYKKNKIFIKEKIIHYINVLGEYIELKLFDKIHSPFVSYYVHHGNKIASLVGFNKYYEGIEEIGRNIAMQIVATNPKYINNNDHINHNINNDLLLYQPYIKNIKIDVKQYIENFHQQINILQFKRFSLIY